MDSPKKLQSNLMIETLGLFAILAAMTYLIVRGVLLDRAKYSVGDGIFAVLILFAEAFILLHGIGYAMGVLWGKKKSRDIAAISQGGL